MEGPSEPKPSQKPTHPEPNHASYDKISDDTFIGPYEKFQPNNAKFRSGDIGETSQEVQSSSVPFDAADDTTATNDPLMPSTTDQPLPPAKYASVAEFTEEYWREKKHKMMELKEAEMLTKTKNMSVPMARVKKIMRIDEDVKQLMIAADAPIFMAQAAEFFIEEMTGMGWQYVSESRRRILQRNDIAASVRKNDQFDFLIDFLPPPANPNMPTPLTNPIFVPQADLNKLMMKVEKQEKPNGPKPNAPERNGSDRPNFVRNFEDRKVPEKKDAPAHRIASDRFKCVVNETSSGNEYQIMEMPRRNSFLTTSAPSTSSFPTPTTSTAPAATVTSRRISSPKKAVVDKNGSQKKPSTSSD